MNTTIPSLTPRQPSAQSAALQRVRRFVLHSCLFSLVFAAATTVTHAAAPVDKPTPSPVSGAKPVEVIGSVEVVGEPFKQRLLVQKGGFLPAGYVGAYIDIPLPAGKRIVIETISVHALLPAGSKSFAQVSVSKQNGDIANDATLMIALPNISPYGSKDIYASVTPATLRFNSDEHKLSVHLTSTIAGPGNFDVSIAGYVEDI